MSSLPGPTLEDYLRWNWNLIVAGQPDANPSLRIAETLGVKTNRTTLTPEQFASYVQQYEPYREQVEQRLQDFDGETQSWRDYAGYAFDFLPELIPNAEVLMTDYKVLFSQTVEDLQEQVKTHLNEGYQLVGGLCVDGSGQPNMFYLYQAVAKLA